MFWCIQKAGTEIYSNVEESESLKGLNTFSQQWILRKYRYYFLFIPGILFAYEREYPCVHK